VRGQPLARQRRPTLYFLEEIRAISPVFLDTEVDVTALARGPAGDPRRASVTAHAVHAAGRVLAGHPEANAAIRGRRRPRIARYPGVHVKVTLDKRLSGQRIVLSAVLRDADRATVPEIQDELSRLRDGDPEQLPEFAGARTLHRLPVAVGRAGFRRAVRPLAGRVERLGTVAVTSLGHWPVDGFYSVGGTTITIGLGRVTDRPVARDGQVVIAPVLRLSLAFDHRVIDGAEAAEILAALRTALEHPPGPGGDPDPAAGRIPAATAGGPA
jgi:pyruvate/2-oxoglutarate dehydrogenase complex dihydrolipoamide acyltransferase (E2) component